ncbi:MAG: SCO family protein [Verrucomicrobiales bacterium]|nr:SCO family protein [Verrucomicrobiales bacterium]
MNDSPPPSAPVSSRIWILFALLAVAALAGSWFLTQSLQKLPGGQLATLPILREVRQPFSAPERLGETRQFLDLKGKVVVAAYAYTRCPHGCAGVAAQMKKLNDAFADQTDRLHFVSIAVWPAIDTPEVFKAYATSLEIPDSAPWWWLSTDRDKTWAFMTDQLGFGPSREVPEAERLNPEDWVEHDLRAVLLDSNLRVRGYYEVMHPQTEVAQMAYEKLQRDITTLLNESE